MQSIDSGLQVSQPRDDADPLPAKTQSSRAAIAQAGVGLAAAAVLTASALRGTNAAAEVSLIDCD
jgi:hypothetical protein